MLETSHIILNWVLEEEKEKKVVDSRVSSQFGLKFPKWSYDDYEINKIEFLLQLGSTTAG